MQSVLSRIQELNRDIDGIQDQVVSGNILEAIEDLKSVQAELGSSSTLRDSRVLAALEKRAGNLEQDIIDGLEKEWKSTFMLDTSARKACIRPSPTFDRLIGALENLGLLKDKIYSLHQGLQESILTPRIVRSPGMDASSVIRDDGSLQISNTKTDRGFIALSEDFKTVIEYLGTSLPPKIISPLASHIMSNSLPQIISDWLLPSVPESLAEMDTFQKLLTDVLHFGDYLEGVNWPGKRDFKAWVESVPRIWLAKRRETSLDGVRKVISAGVGEPRTVERIEKQTVAKDDEMFAGNGDDDWSANWSDEEEDSSEQPRPNPDPETAEDDDAGDAWGWDDDATGDDGDDAGNSNEVHQPAKVNNNPAAQEKEMVLSETYSISSLPTALLEIIQAHIRDSEILNNPE